MSLPSSPPPEQQDLLLIYSSSSDDDLVTATDQIYGGDGERRRPFAVPPAPAVVFAPWFGIGGGPAPAPAASIDALPTVEVSEPGAVCPICKEELQPRGGSRVVTSTTPPASCRGWRCTTHAPSAAPASHHTSTTLQGPETGRWCHCPSRRRSRIRRRRPLLALISSVRRRLLVSKEKRLLFCPSEFEYSDQLRDPENWKAMSCMLL